MLHRILLAFTILFNFGEGGVRSMVDVYVCLIIKGLRTIDQVPTKQRQAVIDTLAAMGLNPDGTPMK